MPLPQRVSDPTKVVCIDGENLKLSITPKPLSAAQKIYLAKFDEYSILNTGKPFQFDTAKLSAEEKAVVAAEWGEE